MPVVLKNIKNLTKCCLARTENLYLEPKDTCATKHNLFWSSGTKWSCTGALKLLFMRSFACRLHSTVTIITRLHHMYSKNIFFRKLVISAAQNFHLERCFFMQAATQRTWASDLVLKCAGVTTFRARSGRTWIQQWSFLQFNGKSLVVKREDRWLSKVVTFHILYYWMPELLDLDNPKLHIKHRSYYNHWLWVKGKAALAAASGGDLARSKLGLEIMGTLKVWVDHLRDVSLLSSKFQKQISAWVNGWISLIWSLFLSAGTLFLIKIMHQRTRTAWFHPLVVPRSAESSDRTNRSCRTQLTLSNSPSSCVSVSESLGRGSQR